jgi:hypothetical protein
MSSTLTLREYPLEAAIVAYIVDPPGCLGVLMGNRVWPGDHENPAVGAERRRVRSHAVVPGGNECRSYGWFFAAAVLGPVSHAWRRVA